MGRRLELPPRCAICGTYEPSYGDYCSRCIGKSAFHEALSHAWEPDQVRIEGKLYQIRPSPPQDPRLPFPSRSGHGFAGAEFIIRFHDGRVVRTDNLWSYGPIPEEYRESLPDNAVFVKTRRRKGGRTRAPGR